MRTLYTAAIVACTLCLQANSAIAVSCKNFDEDDAHYEENMQALHKASKIPEMRWDRNHETAVTNMCEGSSQSLVVVNEMVNNGSMTAADAEAIARALGKHYRALPRNANGILYESINKKAQDFGMNDANSATIATEYVNHPKGDIAKLVDAASGGDKAAQDKLHEKYPENSGL